MSILRFIKAERKSLNEVVITYLHKKYNTKFKVNWSNIHQTELNKTDKYYLQLDCLSESIHVMIVVDNAIREGDTYDDDCNLYLELRDTFDSNDCESLKYDLDLFKLTDTQIFAYEDLLQNEDEEGNLIGTSTLRYEINFVISDCFMIQFDSFTKAFYIPDGAEANWNDENMQDIACQHFDADNIAEHLNIKTDFASLIDMSADFLGDIDQEEFETLVKENR